MPAQCILCGKGVVEGGFCYHDPPIPPPVPPLKLFRVTQEREIYVLAVDGEDAEYKAKDVDANDAEFDIWTTEIRTPDDTWRIPEDWLDCEPFGDHNESITVRQFIEKMEPPPAPSLPSAPLFPEGP